MYVVKEKNGDIRMVLGTHEKEWVDILSTESIVSVYFFNDKEFAFSGDESIQGVDVSSVTLSSGRVIQGKKLYPIKETENDERRKRKDP